MWICAKCTLENEDQSLACFLCYEPRGAAQVAIDEIPVVEASWTPVEEKNLLAADPRSSTLRGGDIYMQGQLQWLDGEGNWKGHSAQVVSEVREAYSAAGLKTCIVISNEQVREQQHLNPSKVHVSLL